MSIIHTGGNAHTDAVSGATIVFDALNIQHAPPYNYSTAQGVYHFVASSNKLDFSAFVAPSFGLNVHFATNVLQPYLGYSVSATGHHEIYLVTEGPGKNVFIFHNSPAGQQELIGVLVPADLSHGFLLA